MASGIDRLREQLADGDYRKARYFLWQARQDARRGTPADAQEFLELASELQAHLDGVAREECAREIRRVENHVRELESGPRPEPTRVAQLDKRLGKQEETAATNQAIESWLGDEEQLVAYAAGYEVPALPALTHDRVNAGVAVTSRRLLLLRLSHHELLLLDALPRSEVIYVNSGKILREGSGDDGELVFEARDRMFTIRCLNKGIPRLAAVVRALRLSEPLMRGPALPTEPVRIGQIGQADWSEPVKRQACVEQELRSWLGDQDELVASVTGRVSFLSDHHLDDDEMQGVAVTRGRLLLFNLTVERELWFVGELPLRDVAVIHHGECGRMMKLFGSDSELLLNLRDRTLRVRVSRADAKALATVVSALPNGPPHLSEIPGQ